MPTSTPIASQNLKRPIAVMRVAAVHVGRFRSRDSRNGFCTLRCVGASCSVDLIMPDDLAGAMARQILSRAQDPATFAPSRHQHGAPPPVGACLESAKDATGNFSQSGKDTDTNTGTANPPTAVVAPASKT